MRVAIVDDIAEERRQLQIRLETALRHHGVSAEILEYENGEDYLSAAKKQPFIVTFLDIYMDGMTGIDTAAALRNFDRDGLLIFTTTSTDHALDGFRVRAMHYLVKPYTEKDIVMLTDEILSRIPRPDQYMDVKTGSSHLSLQFRDIVYAEHFSHKIYIHTTNGRELIIRQSFRDFTAPLKKDVRFFLCNRGVIVNMEHADDFDGTAFILNTKQKITVSRNLTKSAQQAFLDFLFQRGHTL